MKLCEIKKPKELIDYLQSEKRFNSIKYVSKYMNAPSLITFLKSGHLILNNPVKMNDLYEYSMFSKQSRWNNIFYTCFTATDRESMAMWGMYGQPWENGVMMTIPISALKELTFTNTTSIILQIDDEDGKKIDKRICQTNGILSLARIAYLNDLNLTVTGRNDRNNNFQKLSKFPELAGYIKDAAWDYEKEIRLRLNIPTQYKNVSEAYIEVPMSIMEKITVTKGPRCESNIINKMPRNLKGRIKIKQSKFSEKIGWVPCDGCSYKTKKGE